MKQILSLLVLCGLFITLGKPLQSYAQATPVLTTSCANLLLNSSMKDDSGWTIDSGPIAARYVATGRDDNRGLLIGSANDPKASGLRWSSAIQKITLPRNSSVMLSFWYQFDRSASDTTDQQQVALLNSEGKVLFFLLTDLDPTSNWKQFTTDISDYAGQTVQIFFAVSSDGAEGNTRLLIDDVIICNPNTTQVTPAPNAETATSQAEPAPTSQAEPTTTSQAVVSEPTAPTSMLDFDSSSIVSLNQLKSGDLTLHGPFDTTTIDFILPFQWQLSSGAALQLDLLTFLSGESDQANVINDRTGATLRVRLNNVDLRSVPLSQLGEQVTTLSIPDAALLSSQADGRHILQFELNDGPTCTSDQQLNVALGSASQLILPHIDRDLPISLTMLPRPIYQNAFAPDNALIIIPDAPTASELQAAFTVAAGFGRMTNGKLLLGFVSANKLTAELQKTHHLIFIGTPKNFLLLNDLKLPPITGALPDDGVIQIVASPWNKARAVLVVSGDSDAAVIKAGQALSSGSIQANTQSNFAIVTGINETISQAEVAVDRTLTSLGYGTKRIEGTDAQTIKYHFDIPIGQEVSSNAYLSLVFNHSTQIDYEQSTPTIQLNGQPIGSLILNEVSTQLTTLRLAVPSSAIRFGSNTLEISGNLRPKTGCAAVSQSDLWMMVWPESLLHVPLNPVTSARTQQIDLTIYPYPFTLNSTLSTTAIIVAPNDPAAWETASQIAFDLGSQTEGSIIKLVAAYSDQVNEQLRTSYNLLVIGRPSTLPLLNDLKGVLPISFEPNSDQAIDQNVQVSYRLLEDSETSYLEIVTSPWNTNNVVMAALSRSGAGLKRIGEILTTPDMLEQIRGNVVLISGSQIIVNTNEGASSDQALEVIDPATGESPIVVSLTTEINRPGWILPTIIASIVLILVVISFVIIITIRQRRLSR